MSRRWAYGAVLAAAYAAVFLYADPRGPFSLNDDFGYANMVRGLLETGRLRMSQWQLAANIPHVLTGAAAGLFVSPTNEHLRGLNIGVGAGCAVLFYGFLLDAGLAATRAFAGAAALAACPVYLAMSGSFHAEVHSLLLLVAASWLLVRAREGPARGLALASAAFGCFALNRQSGLLAVGGAAAFLARERRLSARAAAAILGPAAAMFAAYWLWFRFGHGLTWAWVAGKYAPAAGVWREPRLALALLARVNACLQTLALFLAPLAAGLAPALRGWPRPGRPERAALAAVALLACAGWWVSGGLPLVENTLTRQGLGVLTLNGAHAKASGPWSNVWIWRALDALALGSALTLVRLAFARGGGAGPAARAALWAALPPLLALLALPRFYDRYLLLALPAAIAAALLASKAERFSTAGCLACCAALAAAGAVGLKDYYAWNRARWEAGLYAVSLGLRPEQVENGFDWDGQWSMERNMDALLARKPPDAIDVWDWQAENRVAMLTSFSDTPPREDFVLVRKFGYRTPLSADTEHVSLFGWRAPGIFQPNR